MELAQIYKIIEQELWIVENRLIEESQIDFPFVSQGISELLNGGKRLRPALLLISAKGGSTSRGSTSRGAASRGSTSTRSIKLAIGVELLHTASLIHDDIVDGVFLRRARKTINSQVGNGISVLAGDYLYSRAIYIFTEEHNFEIMQTIAHATAQMVRGEIIEQLKQNDTTMSEEEYLSIIKDKTASLMSACCRIGSMIGESTDIELEALTNYGTNLGIAFQIADDILDVSGATGELGKPSGNDMREGKITLPFIYTFKNVKETEREEIKVGFKNRDIEILTGFFEKYKAIEYSFEKAKEYADMSKEGLKPLKDSESKEALIALADYVINRNY